MNYAKLPRAVRILPDEKPIVMAYAARRTAVGIGAKGRPALDPQTMRPLYDLPGHLVRRLLQVTQGLYEAEVKAFGVTHAQFAILQTVQISPGLEQREIAAAAGYDSVTASHIIRKLEAMDFLRRDKGSRSRRGHSLHLTEAGLAKLEQMKPAIDRVQERLIERLPPEKRTVFLQLLSEMTGTTNSHWPGHQK